MNTYKRMIILVRSLFSHIRLLPAHTLYKQAQSALNDNKVG
jgi:hypothetical protein